MLLLEVCPAWLRLDAAGASTFICCYKDDIRESHGSWQGRIGVETVLEEEAEFVGLGFPYGMEKEGAVGGEGGVVFGMETVGEGRSCQGEMGYVDGKFIRRSSVGDENSVWSDGVEMREVVEANGFRFCDLLAIDGMKVGGTNIPGVTSGPGIYERAISP